MSQSYKNCEIINFFPVDISNPAVHFDFLSRCVKYLSGAFLTVVFNENGTLINEATSMRFRYIWCSSRMFEIVIWIPSCRLIIIVHLYPVGYSGIFHEKVVTKKFVNNFAVLARW